MHRLYRSVSMLAYTKLPSSSWAYTVYMVWTHMFHPQGQGLVADQLSGYARRFAETLKLRIARNWVAKMSNYITSEIS